jgi:transcriptional regulator
MLVLKTLEAIGPMHGWGVARRIQQLSDKTLQLTQGTIYPALVRLEQQGWITAEWGTSDSNRRARFYSLTKAGRKQLRRETENWEHMMAIINRILQGA